MLGIFCIGKRVLSRTKIFFAVFWQTTTHNNDDIDISWRTQVLQTTNISIDSSCLEFSFSYDYGCHWWSFDVYIIVNINTVFVSVQMLIFWTNSFCHIKYFIWQKELVQKINIWTLTNTVLMLTMIYTSNDHQWQP